MVAVWMTPASFPGERRLPEEYSVLGQQFAKPIFRSGDQDTALQRGCWSTQMRRHSSMVEVWKKPLYGSVKHGLGKSEKHASKPDITLPQFIVYAMPSTPESLLTLASGAGHFVSMGLI